MLLLLGSGQQPKGELRPMSLRPRARYSLPTNTLWRVTVSRTSVRPAHNQLIHRLPGGMFDSNDKPFYKRLSLRLISLATIYTGLLTVHSLSLPGTIIAILLLSASFGLFKTQIALCAHEVGHLSAIRNKKTNRHAGNILGPCLLGQSRTQWINKHNEHHKAPNRKGVDTDIDFPVLAFDASQALDKRRIAQPIIRHQHLWIVPLMCLQAFNAQWGTIKYLWGKPDDFKVQSLGVAFYWAHTAVLAYLLGPTHGATFILTSGFANGLCNGSVFAPNHKGMGLIPNDAPYNWFFDQVIPSRNIHGNNRLTRRLVKFWYGGLQYQIEHHLFPMMSVDNLEKIAPHVREFCNEIGVQYATVTSWQSCKEIFSYLKGVSLEVTSHNQMRKRFA